MSDIYKKIKRRLRGIFLRKIEGTALQFKVYPSYWNYKFCNVSNKDGGHNTHYMAVKPNYGAGIGHQMANWNAGYFFSKYFKLNFAHYPFSDRKWEKFLGLGENEEQAAFLIAKGCRVVRLPKFNSTDATHLQLIDAIIKSYSNRKHKILFLLEQDQSYKRQCDTYLDLSRKFFSSIERKNDHLVYAPDAFNIAVHIRRGDIVTLKNSGVSSGNKRWLDNDYYYTIVDKVLKLEVIQKEINIYIFSQGNSSDFQEFESLNAKIHYCMQMGAVDSYLHMVSADLLISSKSSFSYKPALMSKGIKICPEDFWHSYPTTEEFVLSDNDACFNEITLKKLLENTISN